MQVLRQLQDTHQQQTENINEKENKQRTLCIAFGRNAEFAEKYLTKGKKIAIVGRIQTGSYTKQDGTKVYTTDVVVEEQEFVESKATESTQQTNTQRADGMTVDSNGFMDIPDGFEDDGLPF